jgi:hypothetical protein
MRRALLAMVLLAGCGGTDVPPPTPGELAVQLTPPGGAAAGAVVLTVSGGLVTSVVPGGGLEQAMTSDGSGTHLLLLGPASAGEVAVLRIPDRSLASRYVVRVDQVADGATFALLDATQWGATLVTRP